jgi:phosphatidylinositol-3-phosphatase
MRIRPVGAVLLACACTAAVVVVILPAGASGRSGSIQTVAQDHAFAHMNHVFVIMMENTAYSDLLDPSNSNTGFIRHIASTYGLETNYYGVTHPSLPNYVAATSGSTWGSNSDDQTQADEGYFDHTNLVDQLDQAGVSWKGYMESMPSAGYIGDYGDCSTTDPDCTSTSTGDALYIRRHNPFAQYPDVFNDPGRINKVVPLTHNLANDLKSGHVAHFVWISPNICNDMHGGAPQCPYPNTPTDQFQATLYQDGNNFLHWAVNAIMSSPAWTGHSAIFITWDEGGFEDVSPYGPTDTSGCCDSPVLPATPADPTSAGGGDLSGGTLYGGGHVPMIVISRGGPPHATDDTPTNHYSLLQTIEQNWSLPYLGNASDTANVSSLAPLLHH